MKLGATWSDDWSLNIKLQHHSISTEILVLYLR